ncbi:LysE family transporter [Klebsiella aerogenes]|uniref:LysE family transporter n=1 Tax=Klebsiella aerogenes TaxID=548 RepID=UPI0022270418|nr:LysE family transporter [Klebsiella aerogenes]
MFVIKTSITSGIKRGFAAIFSILLSDVILVLLAWCGLAAVISSTPALFNAILISMTFRKVGISILPSC